MRQRLILIAAAAALVLSPLAVDTLLAQGGGGRGDGAPPEPTPRDADGHVLFGGEDGTYGLWGGNFGGFGSLREPPDPNAEEEEGGGGRGGRGGGLTYDDVPLQDWAIALYEDRQGHELEPHARCKASSIVRRYQTPYGSEFVEFPELDRIYVFDVGGPHTFWTIYMDGRTHPPEHLLDRNGYGHSIGWWEGDTLVVDTIGYDESFWFDRRGIPHTEQLRTLERFTRTDYETIEYEVTFVDPGALKAPWTGTMDISGFDQGDELFEYVCQQANYGHELMLGNLDSVDRSSRIVP